MKLSRSDLLAALLLQGLVLVSPATAIESGIYEGGFSSKHETLKVELRCPRSEDQGSPACEFDLRSVMPGTEAQILPPLVNVLDPLGNCKVAPTSQWDECDFGLWKGVV